MRRIDVIGSEARQAIRVSHPELILNVDLSLRYAGVTQQWIVNVTYGEDKITGVKLSLGVLHFRSKNWPFDLFVEDTSGFGLDPFQLNDFASGRCLLSLVEPSEMTTIRGFTVEV